MAQQVPSRKSATSPSAEPLWVIIQSRNKPKSDLKW